MLSDPRTPDADRTGLDLLGRLAEVRRARAAGEWQPLLDACTLELSRLYRELGQAEHERDQLKGAAGRCRRLLRSLLRDRSAVKCAEIKDAIARVSAAMPSPPPAEGGCPVTPTHRTIANLENPWSGTVVPRGTLVRVTGKPNSRQQVPFEWAKGKGGYCYPSDLEPIEPPKEEPTP